MRPFPLVTTLLWATLAGCGTKPETAHDASAQASISRPAAAVAAPGPPPEVDRPDDSVSRYTSIAKSDCEVVDVDEEAGGYRTICKGVPGYRLAVLEGDARMTLNVIADDGAEHPLRLTSHISSAFSSLGERVEWRHAAGASPSALIVRLDANEDPERPERLTSYLAVARLVGGRPCVVAKIDPGARQNERARAAADAAAVTPCL